MTDDEKRLDRCSKHSALAVLGVASVASVAFFGGVTLFPFAALPLWVLGMLQRVTEKPWFAAAAVGWAAALGYFHPLVGAAALVPAGFFVRHWLAFRAARRAAPPKPPGS